MRSLLFLALVAYVQGFFEPEDLDCCCTGCGDPVVASYDSALLDIVTDQKSLISSWGNDAASFLDICKFGFRVVTKNENAAKQPVPLYIDWAGFGFGFKPSRKKNWRNFLLGQDSNCNAQVGMRGDGFKGPSVPSSNPLIVQQTRKGVTCTWNVTEHNPHFVTVRSDCCPYALNWYPNCGDTCFQLWVGDKYYSGATQMNGMCGQCNGDLVDDYRLCPSGPEVNVTGQLTDISDSCGSGKHQGNGFPGGTRLAGAGTL